MWVADMDFKALPEVTQTIHDYAETGVYGYSYVPARLLEAIQTWERTQHDYAIETEAIALVEGVVPAIGIAIQALTEPGQAVLINTPVYPPFARTIKLNKRQLVENSLVDKDGQFTIDFEQFEKQIVENDVKLYVLCNPHNPGGRVWSKEELIQLGEICLKHGVLVVSDEIHQDFVLYGGKHHSFNTLRPDFKDFSVVLSSATKTFNIAGTKCSFAIIEDADLRAKFLNQRLANNQHEISSLGMLATEAALTHGAEWLDQLKALLEQNIDFLTETLENQTQIKVMKPQGTYLVWLDFSAYDLPEKALFDKIHEQARLILNKGITFGKEGASHARFNVAAPFETVQEAVNRLAEVFAD